MERTEPNDDQGSDTLSQYGDYLCQKVVKSSYRPDTFLLQGHAVTLNFKVATQMLLATQCLNIVIISVK